MKSIPYGHQHIIEDDILAVEEVLRSDWLTQGPTIEKFEKAIANYCGAKYAVAVTSATAALHIACLAAELEPGERLWTSPNTFVASANCGLYTGASVDFVDIDPKTYNLSADELEEKLLKAKKEDKLPKAIIPVHFSGQSCQMDKIAQLAKEYNFSVIEDASHALGGTYKGSKVGSNMYADMTVFSFHPVKIITSGEGGMITTNNEELYQKLLRLRSHGTTRDPHLMMKESEGPWYYEQIELGYNYRMTDIQAALGLSQLSRIDQFIKRRNQLAQRYNKAFHGLPIILPWLDPEVYSSFHLYVIQLKLEQLDKSRREVFQDLRNAGINVNVHYIPVHRQPYYQKMGFKKGDFPHAENYYQASITLPLYYGLSEEDQDYVIQKVKEVLK